MKKRFSKFFRLLLVSLAVVGQVSSLKSVHASIDLIQAREESDETIEKKLSEQLQEFEKLDDSEVEQKKEILSQMCRVELKSSKKEVSVEYCD